MLSNRFLNCDIACLHSFYIITFRGFFDSNFTSLNEHLLTILCIYVLLALSTFIQEESQGTLKKSQVRVIAFTCSDGSEGTRNHVPEYNCILFQYFVPYCKIF